MRCNICDAPLPEPKPNAEVRGGFDPCDTCMEVVEETLSSYTDKPSADEAELGGPDPILEEIYPPYSDPFGTEDFSD